jgi:large conductance mechanosensitive channel
MTIPKIDPPKLSLLREFTEFIKRYGVVGLAIGVVIGQAVNTLVQSIVNNLISPLLGAIMGRVDLKNLYYENTEFGLKVTYGQFLTDLINFLAITFVVYLTIRFLVVFLMTDEEKAKFDFLEKKEAAQTELKDTKEDIKEAKEDLKSVKSELKATKSQTVKKAKKS